jgi:hypothetical protein
MKEDLAGFSLSISLPIKTGGSDQANSGTKSPQSRCHLFRSVAWHMPSHTTVTSWEFAMRYLDNGSKFRIDMCTKIDLCGTRIIRCNNVEDHHFLDG